MSEVKLDDGEIYSLASSFEPFKGDVVEAWFDDKYQKLCAKYPKANN